MEAWRASDVDYVNETGLEAAWIVGQIDPPAYALTAIVKGTFRLRPGAVAVIADKQLRLTGDSFENDDPTKPLRYPSDFAPFKPRTDVVLIGTCHAPEGRLVRALRAGLRVGSRGKAVAVFGDRHWRADGTMSAPEPFASLRLSWDRAFGGPGFDRNPLGRGFTPPEAKTPVANLLMPNLESLDARLQFPTDVVDPVGFGPISETWPQRRSKFGTFDQRYMKERWPGLPADIDWSCFNVASADQQLEPYLRGDEELYFEHLHPRIAQYQSRLPGLRIRCFLNEQMGAGYLLREIPMHIDTVWIDMDSETLVLAWRGHIPVRSRKLIGCDHFLAVTEPLEQTRADAAKCVLLLEDALARRELAEDELEPEELEPGGEEDEEEGADETQVEEAEAPATSTAPAAQAVAAAPETEPPPGESSTEGRVTDEEPTALGPTPAGPDEAWMTIELVRQMAADRASFAGCDLTGLTLSAFDLSGLDLRDAILERANLEHANLSRADLTGAVLAGANLREARCVEAILSGADLTEAWLTGADLSRADLCGADFTNARLRRATLRHAKAVDAIFAKADLSDATLENANLSASDLCDARVHRTDFSRANLSEAAVEDAWGRHVNAAGANLFKLRGAESLLCEGNFRDCVADESVWESAEPSEQHSAVRDSLALNFLVPIWRRRHSTPQI